MSLYPKNPLFQKCFKYLESLPHIGVTLQAEPYFSSEALADGKLTIKTSNKSVNYVCEIKTRLTNDVMEKDTQYLYNLRERLEPTERPLLITRGLPNIVVEKLLEKNIEFIDVRGNIYLNSPEIYLLVRNPVSKEGTKASLEITTSTLKVMYALLCQPNLLLNEYCDEEITVISGVNLKTVDNTLRKLHDLNYIARRRGRYDIINYVKLLERWELGYSEKLRAELLIGTYSPIEKGGFLEIQDKIQEGAEQFNYLIGGELAASLMTDYLRPISTTLHLINNAESRQVAVKLKLKPDPEGNITLLKTFGQVEYQRYKHGRNQQNLVHPLLVHAELLQAGDSRLRETAHLIYDHCIKELSQKYD